MQSEGPKCISRVLWLPLTGVMVLTLVGEAEAIPPPALIQIGSIFVQVLAFVLVLFSTTGFFIRKRLSTMFGAIQGHRKPLVIGAALICCVLASLLLSTLYVDHQNGLVFAATPETEQTASVNAGVMTAAGVEFDITDPTHAIGPQQVQALLDNSNYLFIDIREPVEFSTRHIPGFTNIRAGDLLAGGKHAQLDQAKTVVLACEVGERGSAIAVFLKLRGHHSRYLDGGIRGWLEAELPLAGSRTMQLPDFANKYKKITTEEAKVLLDADRITLVDVRTPKEFAKSHITGALNIPLVNMSTEILEATLAALPSDRPVVGIAQDRFGAYYCLIVGHMLSTRNKSYGGTLMIQPKNQSL